MKKYSLEEYNESGCPEVQDIIGISIYHSTQGKICDTGCHRFNNGKCKAYLKLTISSTENKLSKTHQKETVRTEALRRHISIKEVRRQRRDKLNSI